MSEFHIGVLLAVLSAATFTGLSLWVREVQQREGLWRYLWFVNLGPALVAVASWSVIPPDWSWPLVKAVLLGATPALAGMLLLGLSYRIGDMSHVAPVTGIKALIVPILGVLLGFEAAGPRLWLAAGVVVVALFLLGGNRAVLRRPWKIIEPVLVIVLLTATCYSLGDLIIRKMMHDHDLHPWHVVSLSWAIRGAVLTVAMVAWCAVRRIRLMPERLSSIWVTGPVFAVHGVIIVTAFKLTNSAGLTNVLASLRGVMALVLVLVLGRLGIARLEKLSPGMIAARAAGSLMICGAVYLALSGGQQAVETDSEPAEAISAGDAALSAGQRPGPGRDATPSSPADAEGSPPPAASSEVLPVRSNVTAGGRSDTDR